MKMVLYCVLVILVFLAPVTKQDIGDLEPIQAIWLYTEDEKVVLKTDTEDYGIGATVDEAISAMKKHSEGVIYLDTAQFLLVSKRAMPYMMQLAKKLKSSVKTCQWEGDDVKLGARYLQAHDMGYRLKELSRGKQLQTIPAMPETEKNSAK